MQLLEPPSSPGFLHSPPLPWMFLSSRLGPHRFTFDILFLGNFKTFAVVEDNQVSISSLNGSSQLLTYLSTY